MAAKPHVMTIAGSDSSGGAGIQADLKTIEAFGCYGSSVVTGLTAQNTMGVQGVHEAPPEFVVKQLESVFADSPPDAIKIGMLTSSATISAISTFLRKLTSRPPIILDPVMISTSGHTLLPPDAIDSIIKELLPNVDWITPNIPEAQTLARSTGSIESLQDILKLADTLSKLNVPRILLKGGHITLKKKDVQALKGKYQIFWESGEDIIEVVEDYNGASQTVEDENVVVDILVTGKERTLFVGKKLDSENTHGTGCTLSSAVACCLALQSLEDANKTMKAAEIDNMVCHRATTYVRGAIASATPFGKGHGPLNHSYLTYPRALPPISSFNPTPFTSHLIQSNLPLWESYIQHEFVKQLGAGTLPRECFAHYIAQDYHYLRHYARAHALGAYKASSFEDIKAFTDIAQHIARESEMHVQFCESFDISKAQLLETPEAAASAAYSRYILDVGNQGDILDLYMAVASCLIGYGEVGLALKRAVQKGEVKLEGNPYRRWIEDYSGEDFQSAVRRGIENLERRVAADPPSPAKLAKLTSIWHDCVRLERDFWEMGMQQSW